MEITTADKKKKKKGKQIKAYQNISFLNLPEKNSMSSIAIKVNGFLTNTEGKYERDNYEIRISDCAEHIILHGSLKSPESRRNAFKKLDVLIESLTEAKAYIEKELKRHNLKY